MGHSSRDGFPRLLVTITGMPGAGKSTVASAISKLGYPLVSMGDAVREEASRMRLVATDKNLRRIMLRLRRERGPSAVAELTIPKIRSAKSKVVVVDGLRSMDEARKFRVIAPVKILAVLATKKARFGFTGKRRRSDMPRSIKTFDRRDKSELDVGVGEVIATGDAWICNEKVSPSELEAKAQRIAKDWVEGI